MTFQIAVHHTNLPNFSRKFTFQTKTKKNIQSKVGLFYFQIHIILGLEITVHSIDVHSQSNFFSERDTTQVRPKTTEHVEVNTSLL